MTEIDWKCLTDNDKTGVMKRKQAILHGYYNIIKHEATEMKKMWLK